MPQQFTCPICGRIFTGQGPRIFCSHVCRNKAPGRMTATSSERIRAAKMGDLNPTKRPEVGRKISAALRGKRTGPDHPNFKGEWIQEVAGVRRAFVWIDEAMRTRFGVKRSYAPRARVVWAAANPGEPILPSEPVHHINGDALDDRLENLRKMPSHRAHAELHNAQRTPDVQARREASPYRCEVCGKAIRSWQRFCSVDCTKVGLRGAAHQNAGRHWSPEVRENMAAPKRGKKASPETRERMRAAKLAYWERVRNGQIDREPPERKARGRFA